MIPASLSAFWTLQILAYVVFKFGSAGPAGRSPRWWAGFAGGNLLGGASVLFLMRLYGAMPGNPNLAAVLASGGAFVGTQLVLALVYRSRLTPTQWLGVSLVAFGSALATLGGPGLAK